MTPILASLPPGARILVVRLRSIGDIVLLTPALRLLKEWRHSFRVSVVVDARFRELLEGNPDVDEVISLGDGSGWREAAERWRLVREIRRRGFALCINLHGGPTSTFLTRFSGASVKVGFHHYRSRSVYDILVPDAKTILNQPSLHTAELQACAFFWLGLLRREIPRARLFFTPHHAEWWQQVRQHLLLPQAGYAILHPTALYTTKQWPVGEFARLGAWLEREYRIKTVYSCGPHEAQVLDAVERTAEAAGVRSIRRLEGASLGQFAAALAGASLFVGNDSGPAHMAAALGRPSVVIFGSSSSQIWGPWPRQDPDRPTRLVQNFYDCNPCPGDRCYRFNQPECILSVSFDQVRAAVEMVLKDCRTPIDDCPADAGRNSSCEPPVPDSEPPSIRDREEEEKLKGKKQMANGKGENG